MTTTTTTDCPSCGDPHGVAGPGPDGLVAYGTARVLPSTACAMTRAEDWIDPVAEAYGFGTHYTICQDLSSTAFGVFVASGPTRTVLAKGLTWFEAMDRMRDAVAAELEENGQRSGRTDSTEADRLRGRIERAQAIVADHLDVDTPALHAISHALTGADQR